MWWLKLLRKLICTDTECDAQLEAALEANEELEQERDTSRMEAATNLNRVNKLTKQNANLLKEVELHQDILTGPEPPTMKRVVNNALIIQVLQGALGNKWTGPKHFSDEPWPVCPLEDVKRYLEYWTLVWLPHVLPYTKYKYEKLDGTEVTIMAVDCDDFADCLQGVTALHENWAPFPWGVFWGNITSLFSSGAHAFNFIICCDETYDETSTVGLKAYYIEPQRGSEWTVSSPVEDILAITEVDSVSFDVEKIWMTKV